MSDLKRGIKKYLDKPDNIKGRFLLIVPAILLLLFIVLSSLFTPYFAVNRMTACHRLCNSINSLICHQYPPRCFSIFGSKMGLCARCFSFYLTVLISALIYIFVHIKIGKTLRLLLFWLMIIPLIIDGTTQYFNLRESNNLIRSMTGIMAGIGTSIVLIPSYLNQPIFFKRLKGDRDNA